jgi:hypothetical protein
MVYLLLGRIHHEPSGYPMTRSEFSRPKPLPPFGLLVCPKISTLSRPSPVKDATREKQIPFRYYY